MLLKRITGSLLGLAGLSCWAWGARADSPDVQTVGMVALGLGWLIEMVAQPSAVYRRCAGIVLGVAAVIVLGLGFQAEHRLWLVEGAGLFVAAWMLGLSKSNVPHLLRRELASFFYSPIAYVTAAVFLALAGAFFVLSLSYFIEMSNRAIAVPGGALGGMLKPVMATMVFICPLITMRLLSEEKSSGTIEVLMTAPVSSWEVALSKFFAALGFYVYLLAITLVYVPVLALVSRPDYGPIISTYIGLLVLGAMFLSVGLLVSSFTRNQIVAAAVTFVVLLALFLVGSFADRAPGATREVLNFLSFDRQYETFYKGLVDTRYLVYALSFTLAMLFLTTCSVDSRKWR